MKTVKSDGARIETVCLECNNVLDSKALPATVSMDVGLPFNGGTGAALPAANYPSPFSSLVPPEIGRDTGDINQTFEGYKNWSIVPEKANGGSALMRDPTIPLPVFQNAPPRIFQNRPEDAARYVDGSDRYYGVDHSGHVELPTFPEGGGRPQPSP